MSLIGLRIADCNNIIRRLKLVKLINFIHMSTFYNTH